MPIISNTMPSRIMIKRITKATAMELFSIIRSEIKDMNPETKMVTIKIVTTQRIVRLRARLSADESAFDTEKIPFMFNKKTAANRINLTA